MGLLKALLRPREVSFPESEHLEEIRTLLDQGLPDIPELTGLIKAFTQGKVEYDLEEGTCVGFPLWHEEGYAIQRALCSEGMVFPLHTHPETEVLVLLTGQGVFTLDDQEFYLEPGHSVTIPPETPHSLKTTKESWAIGITIPASEGYPHG